MICPVCHGRRVLVIAGNRQPCAECGGVGTIHCCEGLLAQPEPSGVSCEPTGHHPVAYQPPRIVPPGEERKGQ